MTDQEKKRMSLLGGLIYEGMEETLKAFQQMSRDEQVKTVNKTAEDMKSKLAQIQTVTEQIKTAHIRENLSLILNDFKNELDRVIEQAPKDPLGSFVHLLFLPVELIFRGTELIWGSLYGWLLNMFYPKGPVTPEEAKLNAIEFLTIAGDFNTLATIFDIIGEIQILGTKLPGKAIAKFITNISWTFGLGWMTWVVMSPILRVSISEPMETEMRKITRPRAWTETDIRELYEYGIDKLEEHIEHLAELGYSDDKIEKLIDLMKKRVWRDEIRRWITDMANAYVKGYITDDELMKAIEMGYYTNEERQFRYWEERTRRETKIIDLRIDEIERAFKEGRIDENEARARLSEYIVEPRLIEAYIALWKQYRKPEELVDPLEEAQYRLERLKIRIEGLRKQIEHLEVIKEQGLEVYDAQIEELRARLEAKIAAAREEFAAYSARTTTEIEARITYYEALLPKAVGLTRARYEAAIELLKAIKEARIGEREKRLEALIERWQKELEAKIEAAKAEFEAYANKTISEIEARIAYYESLLPEATGLTRARYEAAIEMLKAIAEARVEEREKVLNALIEKWKKETEAKIEAARKEFAAYSDKTAAEIEARIRYYEKLLPEATGLTRARYEAAIQMLETIKSARIEEREKILNALIEKWTKETEAKIKVIQERKEKYEEEMNERIDRLKSKLEEYELEKAAIERVIERLKARGA